MTAPRPKGTKRADRRALVDAGKRYHAAKLAYLYTPNQPTFGNAARDEYEEARAEFVRIGEEYSVGRRKASCEYGQRHYAKSKKSNQPTRTK